MASADFSFALTKEPSPGKVLFLSLHTVRLYLARLDGLWASLRPASLPPVRGLSADSCSYGQRFVPRFLQLGRAACAPRLPPCGSLRLPPSVPVSTLQLTRNSPCWAHWRKPPGLPSLDSSRLRMASNPAFACDSGPEKRGIGSRQAWRCHATSGAARQRRVQPTRITNHRSRNTNHDLLPTRITVHGSRITIF